MDKIDWLIAAVIALLAFVTYVSCTGRYPGERYWNMYRYARTNRNMNRRASLRWAASIWSFWL